MARTEREALKCAKSGKQSKWSFTTMKLKPDFAPSLFQASELDGKTVEFEREHLSTGHGILRAKQDQEGLVWIQLHVSNVGESNARQPLSLDPMMLLRHPKRLRADFLWAVHANELLARLPGPYSTDGPRD
jgi:hypothetical protein